MFLFFLGVFNLVILYLNVFFFGKVFLLLIDKNKGWKL